MLRRLFTILSGSASLDGRTLTLTVVNPHATLPVEATIDVAGRPLPDAAVTVLRHDDLTAHNTFDDPDAVKPEPGEAALGGAAARHVFPPASVTCFRVPIP